MVMAVDLTLPFGEARSDTDGSVPEGELERQKFESDWSSGGTG
jgi:hypothetical protein